MKINKKTKYTLSGLTRSNMETIKGIAEFALENDAWRSDVEDWLGELILQIYKELEDDREK